MEVTEESERSTEHVQKEREMDDFHFRVGTKEGTGKGDWKEITRRPPENCAMGAKLTVSQLLRQINDEGV